MKKEHQRRIVLLLAVILILPALVWAAYVTLRVVTVGERDEYRPADAIVVLGAREYSGWPSSPFGARLDHALSLYKEGLASRVIVAGETRRETPTQRLTQARAILNIAGYLPTHC